MPNKTEIWSKADLKKDRDCQKLEIEDEVETLRFIKQTKLGDDIKLNKKSAEEMIDNWRERDALNFARTVIKVLDGKTNDEAFKKLLLENARARIREFKNRP